MFRFLAGVVSALLLTGAGLVWWRSGSAADLPPIPQALPAVVAGPAPSLTDPPAATEKTREEKRFGRYDKDKNGLVARDEYLESRRKAYTRLDLNGDGLLSFEEYAIKTVAKYATADTDKSGTLSPAEFATTRIVRKARPKANCPPPAPASDEDG